jgi:hypothetical protein
MIRILILALCLCVTILSCQKEMSVENGIPGPPGNGGGGATTNATLLGVWKLSFIHVETVADNEVNDPASINRTVTKSVYDTKDNTGTMNFTSDLKAITTNFGYSIDTVGMVYLYENNVFQDSLDFPFVVPFSSSTSTSGYRLVGADSIYFTGGSLTTVGGTQATQTAGMKYKVEGSKLTMTFKTSKDTSFVESGVTIYAKNRASGTVTLVK